jgi:hypothetical protein
MPPHEVQAPVKITHEVKAKNYVDEQSAFTKQENKRKET